MKQLVVLLVLVCCFSCKNEKQDTPVFKEEGEIVILKDSIFNKKDDDRKIELKHQKERLYHITINEYDHKIDTIINFDFLESDETMDYSFDYKPFKNRIKEDTLSMLETNMEVVVVKSKFDKLKSVLTYDNDSTNLSKIDGHDLIGADNIPSEYISDIYLNMSGNITQIDKRYYEDLYEPDLKRANAYYYDGEIIIEMNNSDGYLGYRVNLFIDTYNNIKRIVYIP